VSLAALIQLVSACLGIVGSLFLAIGVMRQSVEAMARLSGSYWDWNPHMPTALAAQKADYLFGGGFIVVAFFLQLGSFFAPPDMTALPEPQARLAPWVAGALTIAAFLLLRIAAARVAKCYEEQIVAWLKQRNEKKET
jgi:hypothetical protein